MKQLALLSLAFFAFSANAQFITNNGIDIKNSAVVYTNGDWVNLGSIKNDGTIITTDNWTNNGTLDPTSTGGFVLNFATNKTFIPGGNSFGFLRKEGAGQADVTGQFSVKDSLSIQGGLIKPVTVTDIVTVAETGTVKSVAGSFLEGGNLVRKGTGNLFFPVGKNGIAMPITFLKVSGTNPSVSVTVEDAPAGYTAGAGVDTLASFPYVWKSVKTNATDTATYVELQYPNTLPVPANTIVVRKVKGQNKYEGMGARLVSNSGGVVKLRSYSRGLQGVFSVASGFAGNLETDSLALVNLFDNAAGNSWTKKANWKGGDLATWEGVTQTGQSITSIVLNGAGVAGKVPDEIADILALQTVNLSGNALTSIPDFSGLTALTSLDVSNNKLDFASLEANAGIAGINYANQADIGLPVDTLVAVGSPYEFKMTVGGTANQYQWKRNNVAVDGATTDQYSITAIGRANSGTYVGEATSPLVPGLTLKTANQKATAVADITGKLQVSAADPVTKGKMTLLKINPVGTPYTNTRSVAVGADGTYTMEKIVLDDYIMLGQADTIAYENYFPTYYQGSVFWEAADTIRLNENRSDVNIILTGLPVPPKGQGTISGIFEQELPGGRLDEVENRGRVSGASASVRRNQGSGRPTKVMAEEIIAFVYTNENGVFEFDNLEEGTYLLNIQYPGVPMDTKSDIAITIGPKAKKEDRQEVTALATGGKIVVTRSRIVGVSEEEQNMIQVYPNPVSADLYIDLAKGSGEADMIMFDEMGRETLTKHLQEGKSQTDLSHLNKGIYFLKVYRSGKETAVVKIVK